VQSTRPNPDDIEASQEYQINGASSYLFEAAMIARQANLRGADEINLINPYQFSARSDKAEDNPKGKTGAYVQQNGLLLEAAGVNKVITAECHDGHTMSGSYTSKYIKGAAVSALSVIASRVARDWIDSPTNPMLGQLRLVTPDAGAMKRTSELTQKLQAILGKKLCESRILGEKQRGSHQDDSALISCMNSGAIGINDHDKYLITDDETATGNTLCQAVTNLKNNGAKDISVIIVHNNMPLDWLTRQLCLARFLYLGVNDLHFSDTQEMGTLATSYSNLIQSDGSKSKFSPEEVQEQIFAWFKKNIGDQFADKTDAYLKQQFEEFKSMFSQFQSRIRIHSLANEFAHQVRTTLHKATPIVEEAQEEAPLVEDCPPKTYASKGALLFFKNQPKAARCKPAAEEYDLPLANGAK
jgi:phosphoribosylpyrophosphate synthetase